MKKIRFQTVVAETPKAVKLNFGHMEMWFPKSTQDGRHISTLTDNNAIICEDWFFMKNLHKLSSTDNWRC